MGHTYDTTFDLIFRSERVVAALIQSPSDVPGSVSGWSFIVGNWIGRRNEEAALLNVSQERLHQIETLTLDEVIAANPDSFALNYNQISSVEITHRFLDYYLIFRLTGPPDKKSVRTFTLKKEHLPLAREILSKTPLQGPAEDK